MKGSYAWHETNGPFIYCQHLRLNCFTSPLFWRLNCLLFPFRGGFSYNSYNSINLARYKILPGWLICQDTWWNIQTVIPTPMVVLWRVKGFLVNAICTLSAELLLPRYSCHEIGVMSCSLVKSAIRSRPCHSPYHYHQSYQEQGVLSAWIRNHRKSKRAFLYTVYRVW